MAAFGVQDGQSILFIGDSITDCGRRGPQAPLGDGYVKIFRDLVTTRHPERRIHYINKGISGNRVTDLAARWEDDVLRQSFDWLSIKIGINDCTLWVTGQAEDANPRDHAAGYRSILERTRAVRDCPILLIQPFYISTDRSGQSIRSRVLEALPAYLEAVEMLAQEFGTRLVKTHEIFQRHLEYRDPDFFCPEPVHPHHTGHTVIAEAVYEALC